MDINPNMGSMAYSVPIRVPAGFAAVTPQLSLSYNSGGGSSVVGMGWMFDTPMIERMTYRGLPEYDTDDDFAADGSSQLVKLPGTNPPQYRARYESGFVRTTWMDAGDGAEGYWLAEYPDGSRAYFGAREDGTLVPEARVSGDEGTFRYMLVEKVDVYGHKMTMSYIKDGTVSLPSRCDYVFTEENRSTYAVTFEYEERAGQGRVDYLSDAKAGFNELLTRRLSRINVLSRGITIRSYVLSYAPYDASGGFTLLTGVDTIGLQGTTYPIRFGFEYSQGLGQQLPTVQPMGSLGLNLAAGRATLIDINGDALPDVLDTTDETAHRFFLNVPNEEGESRFDTSNVISSAVGTGSAFRLGAPGTQILDLNGDGFTDLLNAVNGQVLLNRGQGDWIMMGQADGTTELAQAFAADFDAEDGELQTMKFVDYNGDKRIDVVRSTQETTTVYENLGLSGFEIDGGVESIEVGFAEEGVEFSDMNGDGLLDVVRVRAGSLQYRLNYGWGKWGEWVVIDGLPITEAEVELAELEDINGDGLSDLIVVTGNSVKYALNTNTSDFTEPIVLVSNDVDGEIPNRIDTTVLYADMNANGSTDIVWIDNGGETHYLELFPVRPNLLTRITNGIGQVTDITYSSSVQMQARDAAQGRLWNYKLPHPMLVVESINRTDLLTNLDETDVYTYHDGYYDGDEKQFRG
ncbi:MAG: toxin TcdB middle/N-terminal domain-containing protein, partial [Myxococcota bacterium]